MIARNGAQHVKRKSDSDRQAMARQAESLFDRAPPQELDAEKCVLGSILISPDVIDEVALVVRPRDFYLSAHSQIYATLLLIANEGKRADHVLLHNRLKRAGLVEEIGGVAYLAEIADSVPTASNARHYAQIVRDASVLRSLISAGHEIIRIGFHGEGEPRERLAKAEAQVFEILDQRGGGGPQPIGDVLIEALAQIDERIAKKTIAGLRLGYPALDSATGGICPGQLVILAGRPGMGKSAFAGNVAENVAESGAATLYVSLEMPALELTHRVACTRARVNGHQAKNGFISTDERRRLVQAVNELSQLPLFIDDAPGRNMTEIASLARRMKREDDLALIVIDYLQLIEPENRRDPREQQVAQIARRLKLLAREVDVPVICLAQLNREAEKRTDHRPRLADLRESGAIEQDADMVWFVHRDDYYRSDPDTHDGKADVIIAKQRSGDFADVKLNFAKAWTLFEPADPQQEF